VGAAGGRLRGARRRGARTRERGNPPPAAPRNAGALSERLGTFTPFELAALETLTSLAASLCVGLSVLDPEADAQALWNAANLEEDWQIEQWGADEEAQERRDLRTKQFLAALDFARAAKS
jgi:chaperone required for assembly of F1-ATPase